MKELQGTDRGLQEARFVGLRVLVATCQYSWYRMLRSKGNFRDKSPPEQVAAGEHRGGAEVAAPQVHASYIYMQTWQLMGSVVTSPSWHASNIRYAGAGAVADAPGHLGEGDGESTDHAPIRQESC